MADMIPSLDELYVQCRIDEPTPGEADLLRMYVSAARIKAEIYLNRKIYDKDVPEYDDSGLAMNDLIKLSILQLVGLWYENREQSNTIPASFFLLLRDYRNISGT